MAAERDYLKKYTSIIGIVLIDNETGQVKAYRTPSNAEIDDNPDIEDILGTDGLGNETIIGVDVKGFKPVLTLTYGGTNTPLTALQRGRKITQGMFDLTIAKEMQVIKPDYAGAPTGKYGFGVTADAETLGGTTSETGELIPLVQQDFEGFLPATPNSFAIGANFARKFSTDLVTARKFVQLAVAQSINATTISEETLGSQTIHMVVKNNNDTLTYVTAYNAIIRPEGSGFKPKSTDFTIQFNLSGLGRCEPYSVYDSPEKIYCDA